MRALALALLALGAVAEEEPGARWRFEFRNGDRLHGDLRRIRDGSLAFVLESDPHQVLQVPLRDVARAARLDQADGAPVADEIVRLRDDTVLIGRFRGVAAGKVEFDVRSIGTVRLAGDEVEEYLPTEAVVRAYYRNLVAPRSADPGWPLAPARFAALWRDLGEADGDEAWQARRVLVRAGPHAVSRIAERLRYLPDAPRRLYRLVAWLDHDDPEVRRTAYDRLRELRHLAEPVLRESLREARAPEVRARIEALLVPWPAADGETGMPEEVRRALRGIAILEAMGTPEAVDVLEEVAAGDPAAATVRAARAALTVGGK